MHVFTRVPTAYAAPVNKGFHVPARAINQPLNGPCAFAIS